MTDYDSAFHGVATISEKGQVVIPASARKAMGLGPGEKLLVFDVGAETLMLCKVSQMEKFAGHLSQRLAVVQNAMAAIDTPGALRSPKSKAKAKPSGKETSHD